MVEGLPYDSDAGRAYAGAITAVMTGEAYALSAEMAASRGRSRASRTPRFMLEVMRMHRDSVQNIDRDLAPAEILAAAHDGVEPRRGGGRTARVPERAATVLAPPGPSGS